jgi:general secretion pathway protein E
MIGEIRDSETARIAIQAALTGQLVLSTLHTNSATASITRLKNMGIESYLIASTLKAVLSQRLVRKLCQKCSITLTSHEVWRERFKNEDFAKKPEKLLSAVGCIDCRSSGYTGRSTISELFILDEKVQTLISKDISESDLETFARDNGMETLYYSGMSKAWSGETSIEEVMRVTRID